MSDLLFHPDLVRTAGWTAVHFLWQAALIGAGVGVARWLLRDHEASWRYGVSCAGLVAMCAAAVVTALTLQSSDRSVLPFDATVHWLENQLPWITLAWVAGVSGLTLRLAGGWVLVHRIKRQAIPVHAGLQDRVDALRRRIGIGHPVLAFRSAVVRVPMVVGWFKPVILVPGALLTGIPASELEALLAHELGHIRRYDYLVNALQTIAETLFFFHPAVWWLSKHIRVERELCCDDLALDAADRVTYARALLELEELKGAGLTFSFSGIRADGGNLVKRMERLVANREVSGGRPLKLAGLLILAFAVVGSIRTSGAGMDTLLTPESAIRPLRPTARVASAEAALLTRLETVDIRPFPPFVPDARPTELARVAYAGESIQPRAEATVDGQAGEDPGLLATVEPAPPVAEAKRPGIWQPGDAPAFLAMSREPDPRSSGYSGPGRFGFGLSVGAIRSSNQAPLSPSIEAYLLYAIDPQTQVEMGFGFSMFIHEAGFAYLDGYGEQVEQVTNREQQLQASLGIRRGFSDDSLTGFYYGVAGGVMHLPIRRLIGDVDETLDAFDTKTGFFLLPKVGYSTQSRAPVSWDLSAGLSFSRVNGVAFVQPVLSLGFSYWK